MIVKEFAKPDVQMATLGYHSWHVPRLFELSKNLEVMDVPLDHIGMNYVYENINLRSLAGHMKAVNEADLSYPIILDEDGEILDGRHRLMKAILIGIPTIKAVRFETNPRPCKVNDRD